MAIYYQQIMKIHLRINNSMMKEKRKYLPKTNVYMMTR